MIEKTITGKLLESGELSLTERESAALALPEHSTTITIELDGDAFGAQWNGRSRNLHGDLLTERLQDNGQDKGLLRLRSVGATYRLELLPPGTNRQFSEIQPPIRPPARSSQIDKKKKRRATVDRQFHADSEYDWGKSQDKRVGFLTEARALLREQLGAGGFDALELLELRLQGEELATLDDFEELIAVDVANVDRMPHQEAVARHALSRMRGRAVLADEVGLGKTIEAGLAMKELTLRGLAKRVLILCPAPLRDQWQEEMLHKFDMAFDAVYSGNEVGKQDKMILSLNLGIRAADKLTKKPWDIVILDEAHRAAGAGARKTREFITALTTSCRYALFLTATPVQNDLLELYRIVELLRPGTFSSVTAFKRQFMTRLDPRTPNDPAGLRRLISSVMIRTTRAQAGVDRVVRRASDVPVDLGAKERELYALSTDLLRNVMTDSGDTMRRRTLALRLTASPFSMGTTAMAMAQKHPSSRVRSVLNEVGHMAMDIQGSARENRALEITHDWVREHGRVLIFSKHTDTVTSLLRRMDQEGLPARAFHSSMSVSERASTINAFRSGDAPVMISTDAGAEGQNLQFCNCVLNFDLPWNPMRIEQRIGRVDRLTQPRDEVFVANLYARNTIDESVYRLLAEKLRMFELLFGQVTTILGELDDSKTATFETRVLEALFAESDTKMERLLNQLGTELVGARERASSLIAADKGMSEWMTGAFEHRKELPKGGASELLPEVSERTRMRQRRVQAWVRKTLQALDAALLHDTGEEDGAFITAQFGEEFEDELGGRTTLHLAFDRKGLEHHPEAELCAVGSPVFDELLASLRMRGDLHATIPVIPDDLGPSPLQYSDQIRLLSRRLVPTGSWRGQATFRANVGEAETTEHILTADVRSARESRLPRRPLEDGEQLPHAFADTSKVMRQFEQAATVQLDRLRLDREKRIIREQSEELKRIKSGYQAQISESAYEDKQRLQRALKSEERRLDRKPDVRARAKVLALSLEEDDWVIEETWSRSDGVEARLTYEWGINSTPLIASTATGRAIDVLGICSAAHVVDRAELNNCASCDRDLCDACGDSARMLPCPLCELPMCGNCRTETGGLCLRCASPERAPEWDDAHTVAWRLNGVSKLLVGQRYAKLVRPEEDPPLLLVPNDDAHDSKRAKVRAYAVASGLPPDAGLILRDRSKRIVGDDPDRLCITSSEMVAVELSVDQAGGSLLNESVTPDVPTFPAVNVIGEGDRKLEKLLSKLRDSVPPPAPPSVVVTRRAKFVDTFLETDRLIRETRVVNDSAELDLVETQTADMEWRDFSDSDSLLARGILGDLNVSIQRRNDAVLVQAADYQLGGTAEWLACPDGRSAEGQIAYFDLLSSLSKPGGRVGQRSEEPGAVTGPFPSPDECVLVDRTIKPIAKLVDAEGQHGLVPAGEEALQALVTGNRTTQGAESTTFPAELGRRLLERATRDFTTAAMIGFRIDEQWRGYGVASNSYEVFDGRALLPELDDGGGKTENFGVCRDGHFYLAGAASLCSACETWACRACDDVGHNASENCPGCSAAVCRRCLTRTHNVPSMRCVNCGGGACDCCGRDPRVVACTMCLRLMCTGCRSGEVCRPCDQLTEANQDQLDSLPEQLAIAGASVWAASDNDALVAYINRGQVLERAVVRHGSLADWTIFGVHEISPGYKARLAASRAFGAQVVPLQVPLETVSSFDAPHISLVAERNYRLEWVAPDLGVTGISTRVVESPNGDPIPFILDEFPAGERLPHPTAETPAPIRRLMNAIPSPDMKTLRIRWVPSFRDVVLTDLGIETRTLLGDDVANSTASWVDSSGAVDWVTQAWSPVPDVLLYARSSEAEAAVVGLGLLRALGVRTEGAVHWYEILRSDDAPAATMLARWLSLGDADQIGAVTAPSDVRLSRVSNANVGSAFEVQPLGALTTDPKPAGVDGLSALRAWLPQTQIVVPQQQPLESRLRNQLEIRSAGRNARVTLDIGAHVKESIAVTDGEVWVRELTLAAGDTDARRNDDVAGGPLDEGILDREGHFTVGRFGCQYCRSWLCEKCVDGMTSCDCCGQTICKRCIAEPHQQLWLCPACVGVYAPSRREAREHGRLISARGMLVGSDDFHTVVVEHSKNRWERHYDGAPSQPIANPAVIAFLDGRLAAGISE
jgi:superfamily II DNA or RNA helicase